MLSDLTLKDFLAKTSSSSPVPGGGSIAALSAAISASLSEMVANLTIGKKNYKVFEGEMKGAVKKICIFKDKFVQNIDQDANAYHQVMDAYKLPKNTEEEILKRKHAVQEALKKACLVPLSVAVDTTEMMNVIKFVVEKGNKNAITDGAVAAMMAKTAMLAALYNVRINLSAITDKEFVQKTIKQIGALENNTINTEKEILSIVDHNI